MATIMIVEDDRQTNDAVSEYLKSFGHRMLSAYDGDEALQLFERSKIDLLRPLHSGRWPGAPRPLPR